MAEMTGKKEEAMKKNKENKAVSKPAEPAAKTAEKPKADAKPAEKEEEKKAAGQTENNPPAKDTEKKPDPKKVPAKDAKTGPKTEEQKKEEQKTEEQKAEKSTVIARPDRQLTNMLEKKKAFTGPNDELPTFLL